MLLACLTLLAPLPAEAARKRVLLQLYNLRHWSDLSYDYAGSTYEAKQGDGSSSSSHDLEEIYHLEIDYAILHRDLARGNLALDLGLQQAWDSRESSTSRSDNSAGFNLEYQLDGVLFEKRAYPITYTAIRSHDRISTPFSNSYTLTSEQYGTGLSLKNRLVPLQFYYRNFSSETAGLTLDRRQQTSDLAVDASFAFGEFSDTRLGMRSTSSTSSFDGDVADIANDSYVLEGSNTLSWSLREQPNYLDSGYRVQRDWGVSERSSMLWSESLNLQFGRALRSGASYSYGEDESPRQDRQTERRRAWLSHQLFRSLTTRVEYSDARTDFDRGNQETWQSLFNVAYTKELPKQSRLNVSYGYSYGETDNNLADQEFFVLGELLTVDLTGDLFLEQTDVVTELIEVFKVEIDGTRTPLIEGVHYAVQPFGLRTELVILPGSGLVDGDQLSVDYAYRVNSSIEYASWTHSVSAALSLLDNRYRLYGNAAFSDQQLLAGEETVSPLTEQTLVQLGAEANIDKLSLGGRYMHLQSTLSTDTSWEAYSNYTRDWRKGVLNLRFSERYSVTEQQEGLFGGSANEEKKNTLSLFADYRVRVLRFANLNLRGRLADIRGRRDQNEIAFGTTLEARWRRFELLLMADSIWQFMEESDTQELLFSLKLRRYF